MDGFLSTLRDNLTRLDMKDGNLKSKDIEPLLRAFAATVNQLDEAYGKGVADMAMNEIARGIAAGGASDSNMTGVLSAVFNKIALDPTLKGTNNNLTQKLTGNAENGDWWAGGLVRILNTGSRFGAEGEAGLARALSDFYGNDVMAVDSKGEEYCSASTTKKFTLNWE
ncbi:MAG: hypothetical protein LBJ14_02930 [Desulfarculales bacterium]|jgi:hypothetical protein|nr:hypothetical protein [Desulfarculales bacterium]